MREDEEQYQKDVQAALQGQIDFIKYHVALMTFPAPTQENLDRIEDFLSMQHLVDEYFPTGEKPAITITFWGGCPVCARVYAEELSDIDFEDSYAYLYFSTILEKSKYVIRLKGKSKVFLSKEIILIYKKEESTPKQRIYDLVSKLNLQREELNELSLGELGAKKLANGSVKG